MSSVSARLENLHAKIAEAARAAHRDPNEVRLIAVSKLQPVVKVREAFAQGQVHFAENYIQEAQEKKPELADLPIIWHFIGRIQTNKIKALVDQNYDFIHSVDSVRVVEKLDRLCLEASRPQNIFLQFNSGGETSKGGAAAHEREDLIRSALASQSLRVQGLMVMPPLEEDSVPYFKEARETLAKIRSGLTAEQVKRHPMDQLSMGTSHDFPQAIAQGAAWIRIGTDVFGPRQVEEAP